MYGMKGCSVVRMLFCLSFHFTYLLPSATMASSLGKIIGAVASSPAIAFASSCSPSCAFCFCVAIVPGTIPATRPVCLDGGAEGGEGRREGGGCVWPEHLCVRRACKGSD